MTPDSEREKTLSALTFCVACRDAGRYANEAKYIREDAHNGSEVNE